MGAVITAKGREFLSYRLKGAPSAGTEPLNIGWGVTPPAGGPFTANQTDVAPFDEGAESRVAGSSSLVTTTTTNDTYRVTGTVTATGARSVVEVFLSDVTTKPVTNTVAAGGVVGSSSATTLNTGS